MQWPMYRLAHSTFFQFLLLSMGCVVGAFLFALWFQVLPLQRLHAKQAFMEKGTVLLQLTENELARAIESRDDVVMLNGLNSIVKVDDVATAYILDSTGRVLMHHRSTEWGATYGDAASHRAAVSPSPLLQPSPALQGYLFSAPLTSSATLCIGFSAQKMKMSRSYELRNVVFQSLLAGAGAIMVLTFFYYIRMLRPLKQLRVMLSLLEWPLSTMHDRAPGEFRELALAVQNHVGRLNERHQAMREARERARDGVTAVAGTLATLSGQGTVLLDADNRCLHINDRAREQLGLHGEDVIGRHALDMVPLRSVIGVVFKESGATQGEQVIVNEEGLCLRIIAVRDRQNRPAGCIIRC